MQKIHAAVDAREDENFLIIARTDAAWAFRDVEDAIARVNAFTAPGADLVMPVGISPMKLKGLRARHGEGGDYGHTRPCGRRRGSGWRRRRFVLWHVDPG